MSSTTSKVLPFKTQGVAIDEAIQTIAEERLNKVHGLYTRWYGVNRAKMKYWRFRNVTMMSGMSGSGKSAILNMIEDDFTNPDLNPTFLLKYSYKTSSWDWDGETIHEPGIIIVAFKYEMDAADEILRNLSGKVAKPYSYLVSSERDTEQSIKQGKEVYNNVTDEEFEAYKLELDKQRKRPIIYIESAGDLNQMELTVKHVKESYPGKRLIITIDHTLLSTKLTEKDDLELMSNTAKLGIKWRKQDNAAVIFLSQMNGEIEKSHRRDNPMLHFPVKTDIHGGNQVFWACDDVLIWHRPELLNIERYGSVWLKLDGDDKPTRQQINASGIIHCAWIKSRKNRPGNVWFLNRFGEGRIEEVRSQDIRWINQIAE